MPGSAQVGRELGRETEATQAIMRWVLLPLLATSHEQGQVISFATIGSSLATETFLLCMAGSGGHLRLPIAGRGAKRGGAGGADAHGEGLATQGVCSSP